MTPPPWPIRLLKNHMTSQGFNGLVIIKVCQWWSISFEIHFFIGPLLRSRYLYGPLLPIFMPPLFLAPTFFITRKSPKIVRFFCWMSWIRKWIYIYMYMFQGHHVRGIDHLMQTSLYGAPRHNTYIYIYI